MACPWDSFAQAPPGFCERALCAWIREPGNTVSSLAFLGAALVMYRGSTGPDRRHLRPIAHITVAIALGSAIYHATGTAWGVRLDYAGMLLGGSFMLHTVLRRATGWRDERARLLYWSLFAVSFGPGLFAPSILRTTYAVVGSLVLAGELVLWFTPRRAADHRWLLVTLAFFAPAMLLWWLDAARIWCDPDRHVLSGHALWHVLNGIGSVPSFWYYAQFEVLRPDPRPWRRTAGAPPPASRPAPGG